MKASMTIKGKEKVLLEKHCPLILLSYLEFFSFQGTEDGWIEVKKRWNTELIVNVNLMNHQGESVHEEASVD